MLVGVLLAGHGGFADSRLKLVITAGNLPEEVLQLYLPVLSLEGSHRAFVKLMLHYLVVPNSLRKAFEGTHIRPPLDKTRTRAQTECS